jgi:hypothetical protein
MLDSLKAVNFVIIDPSKMSTDQVDPVHSEILQKLEPDFYVTDGPDSRFVNLMDKYKFIILDRMLPEPSTTSIVEQIKGSTTSG